MRGKGAAAPARGRWTGLAVATLVVLLLAAVTGVYATWKDWNKLQTAHRDRALVQVVADSNTAVTDVIAEIAARNGGSSADLSALQAHTDKAMNALANTSHGLPGVDALRRKDGATDLFGEDSAQPSRLTQLLTSPQAVLTQSRQDTGTQGSGPDKPSLLRLQADLSVLGKLYALGISDDSLAGDAETFANMQLPSTGTKDMSTDPQALARSSQAISLVSETGSVVTMALTEVAVCAGLTVIAFVLAGCVVVWSRRRVALPQDAGEAAAVSDDAPRAGKTQPAGLAAFVETVGTVPAADAGAAPEGVTGPGGGAAAEPPAELSAPARRSALPRLAGTAPVVAAASTTTPAGGATPAAGPAGAPVVPRLAGAPARPAGAPAPLVSPAAPAATATPHPARGTPKLAGTPAGGHAAQTPPATAAPGPAPAPTAHVVPRLAAPPRPATPGTGATPPGPAGAGAPAAGTIAQRLASTVLPAWRDARGNQAAQAAETASPAGGHAPLAAFRPAAATPANRVPGPGVPAAGTIGLRPPTTKAIPPVRLAGQAAASPADTRRSYPTTNSLRTFPEHRAPAGSPPQLGAMVERARRHADALAVVNRLSGGGQVPRDTPGFPLRDVIQMGANQADMAYRVHLRLEANPVVEGRCVDAVAHLIAELADNAGRFSAADAPIEIEAVPTAHGLRVDVTDHGSGMSGRELLDAADQLAGSTHAAQAGQAPNTGLSVGSGHMGLAIVAQLAQAIGAKVALGPAAGHRGTRVVTALPGSAFERSSLVLRQGQRLASDGVPHGPITSSIPVLHIARAHATPPAPARSGTAPIAAPAPVGRTDPRAMPHPIRPAALGGATRPVTAPLTAATPAVPGHRATTPLV